jgi:uncharacterized repeat protein (TIGR01451 family)
MNNSTTAIKLPKSSAKIHRVIALFAATFIGAFLQFPNTASAADLAVSIYNTPLDVFTNDYMPYTMYVTNFGPGTVASVVVTNTLPSGFSVVDSSAAYTLAGNSLVFSLGSLTNLAVQKIIVRAKAANSGVYTFSASVSAVGNSDPNPANNTNSFSVAVGNFFPGNLTVSLISTQSVDPQTALMSQFVHILNNGSASVLSTRIVVSGLTNRLWMAAGTNNGNPFVIYGSPLAPGQAGNLLLEFAPTNSFPLINSQLSAFAAPLAALYPPGNLGIPIAVLSEVRGSSSAVAPGAVVVSWPSVVNQAYTVLYSDNPEFANPVLSPQIVPPVGTSQAQWVDYGPPATVSFPTNVTPRYYRVFLNP